MAQRKPIIARAETDNGKMKVPSILLDIVAVIKENMMDTVVKDSFRKKEDVYQGAEAKP
jgi:ABC-type xylose transport system substrate-binding protein